MSSQAFGRGRGVIKGEGGEGGGRGTFGVGGRVGEEGRRVRGRL